VTRTQRVKHLASINDDLLPESTDPDREIHYLDIASVGRGSAVAEPEVLPFSSAPSRARRLVRSGDTIISTVRTYLRAVLPIRGPDAALVVSTGFAVLRPGPRLDPGFFSWVVQSDRFVEDVVARSVGVSYPAINPSEISDIRVPVPLLAKQRAIADYLDAETARIDALIAKKQRMIELLDERTISRFAQLILGEGLPGGRSRSRFYSSVPNGWQETALRHLGCEVQTGPFGSQLHAEDYIEEGWPVVNPMNIKKTGIEAVATMTITDEKRAELARHILVPGDIVFGRRGEMGRAGLVENRHTGWICGTGSLRLRLLGAALLPGFLKLILGTAPARAYFELASVGSTMDNLNSEIVLAFPCLVPPGEVQARVVRAVDAMAASDASLRRRLVLQIELLGERRQALITAAVTGQLEVPGVAA